MSLDYTAEKYRALCKALVAAGYQSTPLVDYIRGGKKQSNRKLVILRHDVDRFPKMALVLAAIEQELGLKASYYFRIPASWNEGIIRKIGSMGHEVGLHYESLDKAKGNVIKAKEFLHQDLKQLRSVAESLTVAMHGNPLTPYDNRDIWKEVSLAEFGILGEAYLSVDFERVLYYSDTGRTWQENKFNIYDRIPAGRAKIENKPVANTTDDLIRIIRKEERNFYILTHPERWPTSLPAWLLSATRDLVSNFIKIAFKRIYYSEQKQIGYR